MQILREHEAVLRVLVRHLSKHATDKFTFTPIAEAACAV